LGQKSYALLHSFFVLWYNIFMTHYSTIPPKPLVAGMSSKDDDINRVFFFERSDGSILAVDEVQAWNLYTRRQQVLGKSKRFEFKLVGTGDGEIYRTALQEAREVGRTDVKQAQEILRKGHEDELEACRGRIIPPRNMDRMGDPNAY
jgi:hypothetical protein